MGPLGVRRLVQVHHLNLEARLGRFETLRRELNGELRVFWISQLDLYRERIINAPDERFIIVPGVEILHRVTLNDTLVFVQVNAPYDSLIGTVILYT